MDYSLINILKKYPNLMPQISFNLQDWAKIPLMSVKLGDLMSKNDI